MSDENRDDNVQEIPGVATLFIPVDLAQQVIDYIATQEASDVDVSGYMFNLGFGAPASTSQSTAKNCHTTNAAPHGDTICDTDVFVEN